VFHVPFPFPNKSRQVTGDFKRIAMFVHPLSSKECCQWREKKTMREGEDGGCFGGPQDTQPNQPLNSRETERMSV